MRRRFPLLAAFAASTAFSALTFAAPPPAQAQAQAASALEALVQRFIAAANARDLDALLALAHDDLEWLHASGGSLQPQTRGKPALRESLTRYHQSCPSCRSELLRCLPSRERLACVEEARWQGRQGPRAQQSLSVYEFEAGLIRRVTYYPVERAAPPAAAASTP